ncbi:Fn3-like domain-containing protein [Hyunsoonleella sp. 2307UL5-6]|uniref:Fn3-like domain-containing protein n=1 Tax=Hyunsoonleella sp. 2307UL5-6 TaxID=3384768 RepID=UPI0039BD87CB
MRKTTTLLLCLISLIAYSNKGFSQNIADCNAELSVEKNRSVKSIGENGTFFTLDLKNTSNTSKTYTITSNKTEQPCKKSNIVNSKRINISPDLDVTFLTPENLNSNLKEISVTVNSGSSQKLYVKVEVPNGTPYNTWTCLKINAKSEGCTSNGAETILSAYISNPSEE